jgi:hypothetical protein
MKQKFPDKSFVRIADDLGPMMSHFESGCEAIVAGTYATLCSAGADRDWQQYSLYLIGISGKIYNRVSWYEESQLTLSPNQDPDEAQKMIECYLSEYDRKRSGEKESLSESLSPAEEEYILRVFVRILRKLHGLDDPTH